MDSPDSDDLISTILFDADGVIQRTAVGWQDELVALLGERAGTDGERFLEAVREAEVPTMNGKTDIVESMATVLEEFSVSADAGDVLELWTRIERDAGMIAAIRDLRQRQVLCCLATNQQVRRARWMRDNLGYEDTFEQQFYSCELGLAKPDPDYFRAILEQLDVEASTVLFVDDTQVNVEGARSTGISAELFRRHGGRAALEEILRGYDVLGR